MIHISERIKIFNIIEELYKEFETCPGGEIRFIIDGKECETDTGYALPGIEFYKNILKERLINNL